MYGLTLPGFLCRARLKRCHSSTYFYHNAPLLFFFFKCNVLVIHIKSINVSPAEGTCSTRDLIEIQLQIIAISVGRCSAITYQSVIKNSNQKWVWAEHKARRTDGRRGFSIGDNEPQGVQWNGKPMVVCRVRWTTTKFFETAYIHQSFCWYDEWWWWIYQWFKMIITIILINLRQVKME